jgi:hypothetical protein
VAGGPGRPLVLLMHLLLALHVIMRLSCFATVVTSLSAGTAIPQHVLVTLHCSACSSC